MKNKNISLYLMLFCYAFFSFALYTPNGQMNVIGWARLLFASSVCYIAISLLLADGKKLKPLANLFILVYIFYLFARQINIMWQYMKVFHGQASGLATFVISAVVIIIFTMYNNTDIIRLAWPLTAMIIFLILFLIVLNGDKVNGHSLYPVTVYEGQSGYKTLFDYIIPLVVLSNSTGRNTRKKAVSFILFSNFSFLMLAIFAFSCVNGNLLYSLSPLQMLFQISSTDIIKNFDAIYNFLLYFAFFSSLAVLSDAYSAIKKEFKYFNHTDLLVILVFLLFTDRIDNLMFIIAEAAMVLIMLFGKGKVKANEEN